MKRHLQQFKHTPPRASRIWLWLFLWFMVPGGLSASHIVGGRIGYEHVQGNRYRITLSVYRDCYNGDPGAPFDDPAAIGIFNRDGILVDTLLLKLMEVDTVSNLVNACIVVPGDVCVHTTTYMGEVDLRPIIGGYQLVYQRCCRNVTLDNVTEPLETGASYTIWLTEEAMARKNTSPSFVQWPPIFICANEPLVFDHSATDSDGDSLVYKLCTPLQGATFANPKPQPPNPPPYDQIEWVQPTYGVDNMLGFGTPLKVDIQSGLMTANPGALGQYVVGVCVEEYDPKTKKLLSVTRRDFQYNVIDCNPITVDFANTEPSCTNLTVDFTNKSEGPDTYRWYAVFPDGRDSLFSKQEDPSFTFPGAGNYSIRLEGEYNGNCLLIEEKEIQVGNNSFRVDFRTDVFECTDTAFLQLTDLSVDTLSSITSWQWEITYGNTKITSAEQNPLIGVALNKKGAIKLTVTNTDGCILSVSKPFKIGSGNALDIPYLVDTVYGCVGELVSLNPGAPADDNFTYDWQGVDPAGQVNPSVLVGELPVAYEVFISLDGLTCQSVHTVWVMPLPKPKVDFDISPPCGGFEYQFTNTSVDVDQFQWVIGDFDQPLFTSTDRDLEFTFPKRAEYTIHLIGIGACTDTVTKTIDTRGVDLELDFRTRYITCTDDGVRVQFQAKATNDASKAVDTWEWILSNGFTSDRKNPMFTFDRSETISVTLIGTTFRGCTDTLVRDYEVEFLPDVVNAIADTVIVCPGTSVQLTPENSPNYQYDWRPAKGIDDRQAPNPVFNPQVTTKYIVRVGINSAPECRLAKEVWAIVPDEIGLDVTGDENSCNTDATLTAVTQAPAVIEWFDNSGNAQGSGEVLEVSAQGAQTLLAIATDVYGCMDTATVRLGLEALNVSVPDTVAICAGDPLTLAVENLDANDILTYNWGPDNLIASGANTAAPELNVGVGISAVSVTVTNQFGCEQVNEIQVVVVDSAITLGFETAGVCGSNTVDFINTSTDAFGYVWDFGDPSNPGATSTETNPSYTYPRSGQYTVRLTIEYDVSCRDTFEQVIRVGGSLPDAAIDFEILDCNAGKSTVEFFVDGRLPSGSELEWAFSNGEQSTERRPQVMVDGDTPLGVTLRLQTSANCLDTLFREIMIPVLDLDLPDTLLVCADEETALNPTGNTTYNYQWSPATGLDNPTVANPIFSGADPITYSVTVTLPGVAGCSVVDEVTVVPEPGVFGNQNTTVDNACVGEEIPLTAQPVVENAQVAWYKGPDFALIRRGETLRYEVEEGLNVLIAVGTSENGCNDTLRYEFFGTALQQDLPAQITLCEGEGTELNPNANTDFIYSWRDDSGRVFSNEPNPTVNPQSNTLYSVEITDPVTGCTFNGTIEVTVVTDLITAISSDTSICGPAELVLEVQTQTGASVRWFNGAGQRLGNENTLIVNLDGETGIYSFIARVSLGGCLVADTVQVTVGELAVDLETEITTCENEPTPLNPNGDSNLEYSWSPTAGLDLRNPANPIATLTADQTYSVTITDPTTGCSAVRTIQVRVLPSPVLVASEDTVVCNLNPIQLTANSNATTLLWYMENGSQIGTGNTIQVTPSRGINIYVVEAIGDGDCTARDTVTVTVEDGVPDSGLEDIVRICSDTPTPLNPNGNTNLNYEWSPVTGLDLSDPANPIATLTEDITFEVLLTDPQTGCTETKLVEVRVLPAPDLEAMEDTIVCSTVPVNLTARSSATALVWSLEDGTQLGTGSSVTVTPSKGTNTYFVEATNNRGCAARDTVIVTVLDEIGNSGLADTVLVCADIPTPLNPNGNPNLEYTWAPTTGLDLSDPVNPLATLTTSTDYQVTVTDPNTGCTDTFTVEVLVVPAPELEAMNDTTLCNVTSIPLTARTDAVELIWRNARGRRLGAGSPLMVDLQRGENIFVAEAVNAQGCIATDTVRVTVTNGMIDSGLEERIEVCSDTPTPLNPNGNPNLTYEWSPTRALDLSDPANPIVRTQNDITYEVIVSDPALGCSDTVIVEVVVVPRPELSAMDDLFICAIESVQLSAQTDAVELIWYNAAGDSIGSGTPFSVLPELGENSYIAEARNGNACSVFDTVRVTVREIQMDSGLEDLIEICADTPTPLNPNGNATLNYRWIPETGLDLSDPSNPVATLVDNQNYQVIVTDPSSGCRDTVDVRVVVVPKPFLTAQNDTTVCDLGPIELTAQTDAAELIWHNSENVEIGTGSPFEVALSAGENIFIAEARNGNACSVFDTVRVFANDLLTSSGLDTLLEVCANVPTPMNPNGNANLEYSWSPSTGLDLSDPVNPIVTISDDADYEVIVTDPLLGCTDTFTVRVVVVPQPELMVMNDTTVCDLGPLDLTAQTDAVELIWYDANNLEIGSGSPISVELAPGLNIFIAEARNGNACSVYDTVRVHAQSVREESGLDSLLEVCINVPTELNPNGNLNLIYAWSPSRFLDLSEPYNPVVTLNRDITFRITVTDPVSGCSDSLELEVKVVPVPNLEVMNDTFLCDLGPVNLTATTDAAELIWYNSNNQEIGRGSPVSAGLNPGLNIFIAEARNGNACSVYDTVRVVAQDVIAESGLDSLIEICSAVPTPLNPNGNGNLEYTWTPATGLDLTDPANPVATLTTDATYEVIIRDPGTGCTDTLTVQVVVVPEPDLEVMNDTTICNLGPLALVATTNAAELIWYTIEHQELGTGSPLLVDLNPGINIFIAEARNGNACSVVDTVRVTAQDLAQSSGLDSLLEICLDTPTQLNPNGNRTLTYSWSPATGLDLRDPSNPIATLSADQTYTVVVSDPVTGCTDTQTVVVVVVPKPSLQVMNDTTVCDLGPIDLVATTDAVELIWYNSNNEQIGSGNGLSVKLKSGANLFIAEARNGNACSVFDTVQVLADYLKTSSGLDSLIEICLDTPTPLNPDGNTNLVYEWSPGTGLDLSDPSNPVATLTSDVTYMVTLSDPATGCMDTLAVEVVVVDRPNLSVMNDTVVCGTGPFELQAATNAAELIWYDGQSKVLGTGSPLAVNLQAGTNIFIAEGRNGNACSVFDTVRVIALDVVAESGLDSLIEICLDTPTPLNPNGNPNLIYTWSPTTGLDLRDPSNPIATLSVDNSYQVIVSDPGTGCIDTLQVEVVVVPKPTLQVMNDTTVCDLGPINLTASTDAVELIWYNSANVQVGTGSPLSVALVPGTNLFIAEARNGNACSVFDTVRVEAGDLLGRSGLDTLIEVCLEVPTPLNPNGNPDFEYSWSPEDGLDLSDPANPIATLNTDQIYEVIIVDPASGCRDTVDITVLVVPAPNLIAMQDTTLCDLGPINLTATTDVGEISWFDENGTEIGTGSPVEVTLQTGLNLFVAEVSTGNACSVSDTVLVDVKSLDEVAPDSLIEICLGDPVPLNPKGDSDFIYNWIPATGLSDPGAPNPIADLDVQENYQVVISNLTGSCIDTFDVRVIIKEGVDLEAGPDTSYCTTPVTHKLRAVSSNAVLLEWSRSINFDTIISMDPELEVNLERGDHLFYVRAANAVGCEKLDSVRVTVLPVAATLDDTLLVCDPNQEVILTVNDLDPDQQLEYLWSPENRLISDALTGPSATFQAGTEGSVEVMLTNAAGCMLSLSSEVVQVDLSTLAINPTDTTVLAGTTISIGVENCENCNYQWDPPELVDDALAMVVNTTVVTTTTYRVTVTKGECSSSLSTTIEVQEGPLCVEENIFIPTGFTPNGDGMNDKLFVRSNVIDEMHFVIFNRWGQEVFDSRDINKGWDGTFRGANLPPDVYGFNLDATCIDGSEITIKGNVTLLR